MNTRLLLSLSVLLSLTSPGWTEEPTPAPAAEAPYQAPLYGTVNQTVTPPAETTAATPTTEAAPAVDMLTVTKAPFMLDDTNLRKQTDAIQIILKNDKAFHVSILQGDVLNGVDENALAMNQAVKKRNKGAMMGGLLRAAGMATSAIPYVGGIGSYATYAAMSATSTVVGAAANVADTAAYNAAPTTTGQFTRAIRDVIISPGETYQFVSLVPKGTTPQVKLIVKNLQTNDIQTLNK